MGFTLVLLYLLRFSASKVVGWLWLTGRFEASGIFLLEKLVQNGNVDFHTDVFVLQDWTSSQHFICWSHIMEISGSDWTQLYTVAQRKKKKDGTTLREEIN